MHTHLDNMVNGQSVNVNWSKTCQMLHYLLLNFIKCRPARTP